VIDRLIYGVGVMLFLSNCSSRTPLAQERVQLNVVSTIQVGAEKPFESSVYYKLLLPLLPATPSKSTCATGYAVNMNVLYLRSNQKMDLNAKLEHANDKTIYQAALNEVTAQFKGFQFPENFFQQDTTQTVEARLTTVISGNSDSVLVLTDKKQLNIWKEKKYLVFTDVESMRHKLVEMICRSKQMSFTILVEPPVFPNVPEPQPPVINPPKKDSAKQTIPQNPTIAAPTKPSGNSNVSSKSASRSNTGTSVREGVAPTSYPPAQKSEPTIIIQPVYMPSTPTPTAGSPNPSSVGTNNSNGKRAPFDKRFKNSENKDKVDAQDVQVLGKQNL
jgi:hypothetical protein